MKVEATNYIPVRNISERVLIKEQLEITKEIIANNEKIIKETEEVIQLEKEAQEIRREIISYKPLLEAGLAWYKSSEGVAYLKAQQNSSGNTQSVSKLANAYAQATAKENEFIIILKYSLIGLRMLLIFKIQISILKLVCFI